MVLIKEMTWVGQFAWDKASSVREGSLTAHNKASGEA